MIKMVVAHDELGEDRRIIEWNVNSLTKNLCF